VRSSEWIRSRTFDVDHDEYPWLVTITADYDNVGLLYVELDFVYAPWGIAWNFVAFQLFGYTP
jgi:hypothetical protein